MKYFPFDIAYLSSNTKKSKGLAVGTGGQGKNSCEGIFYAESILNISLLGLHK